MAHGLRRCLLVAVLVCLAGCQADPPPTDDDQLLGLTGPAPAKQRHDAADTWHLLVYRLTVAADAPLAAARDAATEHDDDAQVRWTSNGMTAVVVTRAQWEAFEAALPPISGRRTMRSPIGEALMPIHEGAPLRDATTITIALGDAGRWRETLEPGRPRLLAQIEHRPDGGLNIAIVPQQHVPRSTLRVRTAAERMLDGLVLHQLRLERTLSPGDVLVIMRTVDPAAPDPPADGINENDGHPAAADDDAADDSPADAASPDDTDDEGEPHEPTRPLAEQVAEAGDAPVDDLGRLLLEGKRAGQHVSVVLLITAQWPGDATDDDAP